MTKTKLFLAILSTGLLALGGLATTVAAEGDDDRSPREKAQDRREQVQERREVRKERMDAAQDAWQECKRPHQNASLNESVQRRCMAEKSFFLNATHARREGRALVGAIAALERQIGRLEVREMHLEEKLASGNLTGNQTAESVQAAIDKIDAAQERLAEKLDKLKARLAALHEKWQSVRDEVKERRRGDAQDDDQDDDQVDHQGDDQGDHEEHEASSSPSPTASA